MSDLIDRYIWAVSERLPQNLRHDVGDELRTTIADMVEERDSADATREVLIELGDPAELARGYTGERRYLIGPGFYDDYVGLLRVLAATVLPVLLVVFLVVELWDPDQTLITGALAAVGSTVVVAGHIAFWATLVFVILERTGVDPSGLHGERCGPWDPDRLPEVPSRRQITLGDLVTALVMLATPVLLVFWQRFRPVLTEEDGTAIPVIDPDLWQAWIPALFALITVTAAVEIWKFRVGRWTLPVTIANAAVNVAWLGYVAVLVDSTEVINPQFTEAMEEAGNAWSPGVALTVAVLIVVVVCVWDTAEGVLKHRRLRQESRRRAPAAPRPGRRDG
jgi:hypothetical protein